MVILLGGPHLGCVICVFGQILKKAGVAATDIMAIAGHKNQQFVRLWGAR